MQRAYLERHDNDKNMHRFYQMHIAPNLFNEWSLIHEWGRVGSSGKVHKDWFETEEQAIAACKVIINSKQKRGYQIIFLL